MCALCPVWRTSCCLGGLRGGPPSQWPLQAHLPGHGLLPHPSCPQTLPLLQLSSPAEPRPCSRLDSWPLAKPLNPCIVEQLRTLQL